MQVQRLGFGRNDMSEARRKCKKRGPFEGKGEVRALRSFITQHEKVGKELGCCHASITCGGSFQSATLSLDHPIVSSGIYSYSYDSSDKIGYSRLR